MVVNATGNFNLLHAGGTVDGFEARAGKFLLFAYYGGIYIDKDVAIDANGKPVGYGYIGSANSQNKAIQEITFGFNETVWASPRYGAINLIGQYEYLTRNPWYIALGRTGPNPRQHHLLRRPLYAAGQHAEILGRLMKRGGASRPPRKRGLEFMKKQMFWIIVVRRGRHSCGIGRNHQRGGGHVPRADLSEVV